MSAFRPQKFSQRPEGGNALVDRAQMGCQILAQAGERGQTGDGKSRVDR